MTLRDLTLRDEVLYMIRQREKPKCVCHVLTTATYTLPHIYLLKAELFDEPLKCFCAIDSIEIFALQVFDDGKLELCLVGILPGTYDDRHLNEARQLARAQAPLTCDELILHTQAAIRLRILRACHREGLEEPVHLD